MRATAGLVMMIKIGLSVNTYFLLNNAMKLMYTHMVIIVGHGAIDEKVNANRTSQYPPQYVKVVLRGLGIKSRSTMIPKQNVGMRTLLNTDAQIQ